MSESGPTFTLNVPVAVAPAAVNTTEKEASPCKLGAKSSIGSTVKLQPLPVELRVTEASRRASTNVASAQVMVALLVSVTDERVRGLIVRVRLRPTSSPVGGVKIMFESPPMFTVNVPLVVSPPVDVNSTLKEVLPCDPAANVSMGSTVKVHLSPVVLRVTAVSFVLSTAVASPQLTA